MNNPTFQTSKNQAKDPKRVSSPPAKLAPRVENSIETEFDRVTRLSCPEALNGTPGAAKKGAGEVANSGVILEVFAPRTVRPGGFFEEKMLGGGGELVELGDRNV
uniref:Uncharacterized protein n=1 Tax=Cucumis sativus TaxID=3659 RepID=A0A0A0LY52_CUCSA